MQEFKHIPRELWPDIRDHVEYEEVYRATKSKDVLTVDDFLPWNIEYSNQKKTFKNLFKQPEYGMSVFTEYSALMSVLSRYPSLDRKTQSISKGRTSIIRGISTRENTNKHVDYFLYDYLNNSPKDDFEMIEVRNLNE